MLTEVVMPALVDEVLAKAGYVRLSKYGLMLTPQGHIISLQPRLPDEGSSARIVGWLEGCEPNGSFQLPDQFVNPPRAAAPAVASPVATPRPSALPPPPPAAATSAKPKAVARPLPGVIPMPSDEDEEALWAAAVERAKQAADTVAPPVAATAAPAPIPVPPPVPARPAPKLALVSPPSVKPSLADNLEAEAADDEDDGDEWEWQLALARARAAAEEAEAAKTAAPPLAPAPAPAPKPAPAPAPVAAKPAAVHIPPKADPVPTRQPAAAAPSSSPAPRAHRPSEQPRPMRASNTGWKPPVPPTRTSVGDSTGRTHVNDQTSPRPKLPLVAETTGTDVRRIARGTESPTAVVEKPAPAAKPAPSSPRLTLVSAEPRPLPPPAIDDDTHVDLVKVKAASKPTAEGNTPTPTPSLPRLSARR
jgi:hypothetical protein